MKKIAAFAIIILIAAGGLVFTQGKYKAHADEKVILGYTTSDNTSLQSIKDYHSHLTAIAMDTYAFDTQGNLTEETPKEQVNYANKHKIDTYAVISNFGETDFDPDLAHAVMSNEHAKKRFIAQLASLAEDNNLTGINIDFESIYPEDRDLYSKLIKDTAQSLQKNYIKTMVSVPAKTADDPANDWTWPYNYKKIGEYADYVQVMTYDEHGSWSEPGSSASKNWVKDTLTFATEEMEPDKVIMGIPAYGYDWNLNNPEQNKLIEWDAIHSIMEAESADPVYDEETASAHFTYIDDEKQEHIIWYEDKNSLTQKSDLTNQYDIAGLSVYALGYESRDYWNAIETAIN
ncbi:glycosyl hydrolase family 18 protein [Terribacillus sp. DMT04]|uniref:glycosyl hydrolase family 18 protein n=1 Tax=Terribacillus sp. DMT04 TaxID=2850441 RepID=UPI001C2C7F8D|nr:glycosyl hydrolase family 18 protein [Terribacillus sp. DMT04]QXE01457.1 glycosylase [Terribacillus sp. DMT04]